MRTSLPIPALASILMLLASASLAEADCMCERLSSERSEGCSESGIPFDIGLGPHALSPLELSPDLAPEAPDAPLWCERANDPRCMPAQDRGQSEQTIRPIVPILNDQQSKLSFPGAEKRRLVFPSGNARPGHERRIDRPPR